MPVSPISWRSHVDCAFAVVVWVPIITLTPTSPLP